jgi:mannose-6-phosphate isomerase-like protein (cupin superfamily)
MQTISLADLFKGTGQGRSISIRGATITIKADSADTDGAWSLMEYLAPPHFEGPPAHWHAQTVEAFYILEGTLTFTIGEQTITAGRGSFVLVPTGVVHGFLNATAEPVRFLTFCTPGGFEGYFDDLAALVAASPAGPPNPAALATLWERYDIRQGPLPGV